MRAFLGLGSNVGDRLLHLRNAIKGLPDVVRISPLYESEPLGGPDGQDWFLNCVIELDTHIDPHELLKVCLRLEREEQRDRAIRWGPRTLDIDVLLVNNLSINEPELQIPHPRMHERRFVMAPLADIAPDVAPVDWEKHATGAIRRLDIAL